MRCPLQRGARCVLPAAASGAAFALLSASFWYNEYATPDAAAPPGASLLTARYASPVRLREWAAAAEEEAAAVAWRTAVSGHSPSNASCSAWPPQTANASQYQEPTPTPTQRNLTAAANAQGSLPAILCPVDAAVVQGVPFSGNISSVEVFSAAGAEWAARRLAPLGAQRQQRCWAEYHACSSCCMGCNDARRSAQSIFCSSAKRGKVCQGTDRFVDELPQLHSVLAQAPRALQCAWNGYRMALLRGEGAPGGPSLRRQPDRGGTNLTAVWEAALTALPLWGVDLVTTHPRVSQQPRGILAVLPLRRMAVRGLANYGHWLAEAFGPLLFATERLASPELPVALVPALALQCEYDARRKRRVCSNKSHRAKARIKQSYESIYDMPSGAGLPWLADFAPAPPEMGFHQLAVACGRCPPQWHVAGLLGTVRRWLQRRYRLSFAPRPSRDPGAPRRLLMIQRRPNGSRWIANFPAAAAAAADDGWQVDTAELWRRCGYGGLVPSLIQGADVIAGMHGADLAYALTLARPRTAVAEIVPEAYAAHDPWYAFQGVAAGAILVRWVIPDGSLNYTARTAEEIDSLARAVAGRPNYWRKLPCNVTLALDGWRRMLRIAVQLVTG
eukprot:TRINITY_DN27065_c0_g1_i1.p1 TRINITY_DN27065_c0_g1~~TRINITY_DN27065_c0_g1_i1.p1  ORF type:complete len:647 (+),score=133.72 TRINITY_DN27065_c0_g1_i1:94-1941(+)